MIDVTVVVPTYRRTEMLRRNLESCLSQSISPARFEVLVVDNCPDASARDFVMEVAGTSEIPVRYMHEPRRGVSHARNSGLEHARANLVAFIDDDEVATHDWLPNLLSAQKAYDADVVFAPVMSILPDGLSEGDRHILSQYYTCTVDAPTGTSVGSTILVPFWKRGRYAYPRLASGNVLIARNRPLLRDLRFDPRMGLGGGEDTLYFTELAARGARMIWCAEAIVTEEIAGNRLNVRQLCRRAFYGGKSQSALPLVVRPRRYLLTPLSMLIGTAQACIHGPLWAGHALVGSPSRHHHMRVFMAALGKVVWLPYPVTPFNGAVPSTRSRQPSFTA